MGHQQARHLTIRIVRASVIAGLYVALCTSLMSFSFGPVQFRLAEGLTLLPLIFPEAIVGVGLGCLIANFAFSGWIDATLGTAATIVAACLTWTVGRLIKNRAFKIVLGVLPPILLNAFVVPFIFYLCGLDVLYWFGFGTVLAGQCIAVLGLGIPLYFSLLAIYKPKSCKES